MKPYTLINICLLVVNMGILLYPRNSEELTIPERHNECTKETLSMHVQLGPYFDQFLEDCAKYGYDCSHVYCLRGMGFEVGMNCQGYTSYDERVIRINPQLLEDSIGLRFVLYHELGHWLGLRHSDGIMETTYSSRDSTWTRERWEELKDQYFKKLQQ